MEANRVRVRPDIMHYETAWAKMLLRTFSTSNWVHWVLWLGAKRAEGRHWATRLLFGKGSEADPDTSRFVFSSGPLGHTSCIWKTSQGHLIQKKRRTSRAHFKGHPKASDLRHECWARWRRDSLGKTRYNKKNKKTGLNIFKRSKFRVQPTKTGSKLRENHPP